MGSYVLGYLPTIEYCRQRTKIAERRLRKLYPLWFINPKYYYDINWKFIGVKIAIDSIYRPLHVELKNSLRRRRSEG